MKKRALKKILIGTSVTTSAVLLVGALFMLMVIGMYQQMIASAIAMQDSVTARSGNLIGTGDATGVIDHALSYIGTPYKHGGESYLEIDCSGLVLVSYKNAGTGIDLPHASYAQATMGDSVYDQNTGFNFEVYSTLDLVSTSQSYGEYTVVAFNPDTLESFPLLPGDVICFAYGGAVEAGYPVGHVGIYIGNGWFVHSLNVTNRTFISPFYDLVGDGYGFRTKIYTIRRFLGTSNLEYGAGFMPFTSDLVGHPIYVYYDHVEMLAQYLYANTADLLSRERYQMALGIINQARTDQTSIKSVINQMGGASVCLPDEETWRIVRCALLGHYFYPADGAIPITTTEGGSTP